MESPDLLVDSGVLYGMADGQELLLDVIRLPGGDGLRPAVVVVHGGFLFKGGRGDLAEIAHPLTRAGYVIFDIDYRLFVMASGRNLWPAQLDDAQRARALDPIACGRLWGRSRADWRTSILGRGAIGDVSGQPRCPGEQ